MDENTFRELVYAYLTDCISPADRERFFSLLQETKYQYILERFIDLEMRHGSFAAGEDLGLKEISAQSVLRLLEEQKEQSRVAEKSYPWQRFFRYAAAVTGVFILGAAVYFFLLKSSPSPEGTTAAASAGTIVEEVLPGSEKAILTLSDGKTVVLGEGAEVLEDQGVKINKSDGQLVYSKTNIVALNTMRTPRGGQYKLILPDGTLAWLNAASSITFPTSFQGSERKIKVTGEVYLEVTRNEKQPFIVETGAQSITVLGTRFNINAYEDEVHSRTTLVEGLIQVNNTIIRPGQVYTDNKVEEADVDQVLAWKNGLFNFHKMQLATAMRQLSRWYDIDVSYEGPVPDLLIFGEMGRDLTLSQVLEVLEDMNVHYRMEGRKLTILSS